YSDAHLGHGKTATAFDVVRRWLEYRGLKVRFVSNVTDVGHITDDASDTGRDRINERAKLEKLEPMEIADAYMWGYFDDMARLGIRKPSITPRATGHILEQIELVQRLVDRGLAYERDGSVYFRVRAFPEYGKLSGRKIDELEVGTREDVREDKDDPLDFALWKFAEPEHIMRWNSPWGEGFPGWHIECSAMALKYLGEGFDIHAGGLDLQFPHHEAEIAQTEGAGYKFARYWMHGNMLTVNGEKMSKSKGNFLTLKDFYAKSDPMLLRFIFVQSHYRSVAELTDETIQAAQSGLSRLREARRELERRLGDAPSGTDAKLETAIQKTRADFEAAMDDDFNTPEALAALFGLTREVNTALAGQPGRDSLEHALKVYEEFMEGVLGLTAGSSEMSSSSAGLLDGLLEIAIEARKAYRQNRDFARSDALRDRLKSLGVTLEDTANGTRWKLD
ncbi:MAG: cysteine--tRNA ligase, partial [Pleurocapsa sp. SU_196_0]|nr:cysteine--tRNA ligase [Pleurocapsa sp. SU_196_0]